MPAIFHCQLLSGALLTIFFFLKKRTYRAVNHEPEEVLDVVICHDSAIGALPHALPIGLAPLDR
jgi:hypothetical protein